MSNLHSLKEREIAELLKLPADVWHDKYGKGKFSRATVRRLKLEAKEGQVKPKKKVSDEIAQDKATAKAKAEASDLSKKYKALLKENERILREKNAALDISKKQIETYVINPKTSEGKSEGAVVVVASDWHIEERVTKESVNGLNEYNLEISKSRSEQFFRTALRLTQIEQQALPIKTMVLALLGDFISSDIHEDIAKSCLLQPMHAIARCEEYIASGIEHILKNSELKLIVVCQSGNHGRKDKEQMIANEAGNSLEYGMYHHLKTYFRHETRVEFIIPEGYHAYLKVFNTTLRLHHGHAVRYGGGVGGIYIPLNKRIAQWNNGVRADIDILGHFHQLRDGGNFIANGSMIGFNPYAINIGASFERPQQAFFLIHSRLGKILTRNIVFE